jgi:2'-5' RNA ligase
VPESAVIAPVRAAQATIGRLHSVHTPAGRAGMIPHVTLLYPFVHGDRPTADTAAALAAVLAGFAAFEADFRQLARFTDGQAVAYAQPDPAEPFIAITRALSAAFGIQPYGGVYDRVIPHMTVASIASLDGLDAIEREARPMLPISCRIDAAEVWVVREGRWRFAERVALGGAA